MHLFLYSETSCSSSPSSAASQGSQFAYDDYGGDQMASNEFVDPHHYRANSLPAGSLHSCVGSFVVANEGKKKKPPKIQDDNSNNNNVNKSPEIMNQQQNNVSSVMTNNSATLQLKQQPTTMSNNMNPQLLNKYQFTTENENNRCESPIVGVYSNNTNNNKSQNYHHQTKPYQHVTHQISQLQQQQQMQQPTQQFIYYSNQSPQVIHVQNNDQQQAMSPTKRKISLQLGSHGLTCIKTSDQPFLLTSISKTNNTKNNSQYQPVQSSQMAAAGPVLFRTEMTILPSSFNNNKNNNNNANNSTNTFMFKRK